MSRASSIAVLRLASRGSLLATAQAHLAAAEPTGISPPPLDRITRIN